MSARPRGGGFGIEQLPRIAYGRGSCLYDEDGKRYLDGSGGPAVFSVGHAHPEINAAIMRQLERVAYGYRYLFTSSALEELTRTLLALCGGDFGHVIYSCSGSEAMESALKMALQYYSARGLPARRHFIARERSWHGNTLGALSVSGFAQRRRAKAACWTSASSPPPTPTVRLPASARTVWYRSSPPSSRRGSSRWVRRPSPLLYLSRSSAPPVA